MLTGDRPTGRLHVGHYVGSLRRRVELQNTGEFDDIFIMIADAQALTDNADNPEKVRSNIIEARFIYLNYSNRTLSGTVQMRFNLLKPETILYLCPVFRIKRI